MWKAELPSYVRQTYIVEPRWQCLNAQSILRSAEGFLCGSALPITSFQAKRESFLPALIVLFDLGGWGESTRRNGKLSSRAVFHTTKTRLRGFVDQHLLASHRKFPGKCRQISTNRVNLLWCRPCRDLCSIGQLGRCLGDFIFAK